MAQTEVMRLARVLGMLGSNHDGEVLAAARAAEKLRAMLGRSWVELLISQAPFPMRHPPPPQWSPPPPRQPPPPPIMRTWRDVISDCLECDEHLTDFDRKFLVSLKGFPRMSEKQRAVLVRIAEKLDVDLEDSEL